MDLQRTLKEDLEQEREKTRAQVEENKKLQQEILDVKAELIRLKARYASQNESSEPPHNYIYNQPQHSTSPPLSLSLCISTHFIIHTLRFV